MSEQGRRCLPRPRGSRRPVNTWRLAKDLIGTLNDFQSLPLPVDVQEPYTEGMKGGEHILYAELLDKVCAPGHPKYLRNALEVGHPYVRPLSCGNYLGGHQKSLAPFAE